MTIGVLAAATGIAAQNQQPPGHPIGTVTTKGELIVLELDAGAIAPANLFDLARRTLRFTPDGNGYRVENVAVQWDADFGTQITSPIVPLRNFTFPFSGKRLGRDRRGSDGHHQLRRGAEQCSRWPRRAGASGRALCGAA
jgi:hypothetical protein